ncbi:MAG: SCO family protein [Actinobacteria bacterium]|nr:SCO family protein [Actinomycetota bacterium]
MSRCRPCRAAAAWRLALTMLALLLAAGCSGAAAGQAAGPGSAGAANPELDTGTPLNAPAPGFRLVNQFGQAMSLSQFRGKAVILAFNDSECTTMCPLTTAAMVEARQLLGPAGNRVQLLGVNANPHALSIHDVMAYSQTHGMVNKWDFLTGSRAQLERVWRAYHIALQIERGEIDHTPALMVIDPQGRERMLYLTQMYYAGVGQQAQLLAHEVSRVLPGHPAVARHQSLAFISGTGTKTRVTLPGVPDGSVSLGPGRPRLVMFFATWLSGTTNLGRHLLALNRYAEAARSARLPGLTAVDVAATEPSPGAAAAYLKRLGRPLAYPVARDDTGRVADGYGVQDQPWFVLVSAAGKIAWRHHGWLGLSALEKAAGRA